MDLDTVGVRGIRYRSSLVNTGRDWDNYRYEPLKWSPPC